MEATRLNKRVLKKKARKDEEPVKVINVQYQKELNLIITRGSSIKDYSAHKYDIVTDNINEHFRMNRSLHLYFNYDYIDSSAFQFLNPIVELLNEFNAKGKSVRLFWSCLSAGDDAHNLGMQLKEAAEFDFNM